MEIDVKDIIEILNKQNEHINELLELAGEQLQALKRDDLDEIKYITSQQEYIGRQLAVLEQQRRVILEQYSQEFEIDINNFSELQMYTSKDVFAEIQKIRDEIINGCQKIKEKQGLNALLLKQGLKYTERMMGVLNGKKSFIYGKTGDIQSAGNIGIVDANA